MWNLGNIRIGRRFLYIFSLITLVTGTGLGYIMLNLSAQKSEVDSIYKVRLLSIENLIEADRDAYQSSIAVSQLLNAYLGNAADPETVKKRVDEIKENLGQLGERFGRFSKLYLDSGGPRHSEFDVFDLNYKELRERTNEVIELFRTGDISGAASLYNGAYMRNFTELRNAMDRLTAISLDLTEKEYVHFNEVFLRMIFISIGIAVMIIIILSASGIVLTRSITGPISLGIDFARKLALGDFRDRIALQQDDEFGDLSTALNEAADDLEKLVSDILDASTNLAQAVNEIAGGNQNLSQRTAEQASSLEEVAATIEESSASIRMNAENSEQANRLSGDTMKMAEEGNRVVVEAVSSINEINRSSKKIEEIISLINEISFQTNLLALNAAVEAARAGEQGRGFAVVAGEVRNLAQRSASAAKEIGALIKESTGKIDIGTDLANKSGDALREIVGSMRKVARLIADIAAASHEQKQGIEQINVAISEMDTMTQQNAALVEQTASASEEMASQARELQAMMERFRIRETLQDSRLREISGKKVKLQNTRPDTEESDMEA